RTPTFPTRKALALLVYRAVEGRMHPRKTLSESFWPELDAEHGRAALRATLLELRKLLERSHGPGEQSHLLVERDTLGFDQGSPLILDLQLVESASKQVGRGTAPLVGEAGGEFLAQPQHATRSAVLSAQLQVGPDPESVALAKAIRHTAPARAPQARSLRPSRTSPGRPPANLLGGPFLGRAADFGTLIECYQRVYAGQPQP